MEKSATQGSLPLTTFVQADTSTFRELVQKLTGATDEELRAPSTSSPDALESALPTTTIPKPMGVKRPTFKLHERRQYSKPKLEIVKPSLNFKPGQLAQSPSQANFQRTTEVGLSPSMIASGYITSPLHTPSTSFSNLSILDRDCKDSSCLNSEEEERAIKERRFYLHPSPRSRAGDTKPELLPLFPLTSPTSHES